MLADSQTVSHLVVPVGVAVSLIALMRYFRVRGSPSKTQLPHPPGPKGLPFIGNILDIPRDMPIWEAFGRMAEKHRACIFHTLVSSNWNPRDIETDVMYLKMLGRDMVVLSSSEAIEDLLEKRSAIYSDRVEY